jgi:hypothetical protein
VEFKVVKSLLLLIQAFNVDFGAKMLFDVPENYE